MEVPVVSGPNTPASRDSGNSGSQLLGGEVPRLSVGSNPAQDLAPLITSASPAVLDNLSEAWPALERWSPEQLSARFGSKKVRVYDGSFGDPGKGYMDSVDTMPFAQFLEDVLVNGRDLRMFLYNIGRQIPELLEDIAFPDIGLQFSRRFVYTFFGCKGATTPLHYDIDMGYVLHTVIRGRRRVRLFAPDQSTRLYQHPFTVRSYVDLDRPDYPTYPALGLAQGFEVVLEPGDTLFMPAGYWHEFHYLEAGMGLSMRAASPRLSDRAKGLVNILALSPVDRLANKIATDAWFDWKKRRSVSRAVAYMNKRRYP